VKEVEHDALFKAQWKGSFIWLLLLLLLVVVVVKGRCRGREMTMLPPCCQSLVSLLSEHCPEAFFFHFFKNLYYSYL
jgi:hypothetical protein